MVYLRNEIFIRKLGKRIRQLRIEQKISQAQLAFEAEIPRMQVVRIENGTVNTSVSSINAIAKALNIPVKEIFDF